MFQYIEVQSILAVVIGVDGGEFDFENIHDAICVCSGWLYGNHLHE